MKRERFTVWGVDRAGVPWDIESFDNPLHALRRYNVELTANAGLVRSFGISDSEDTDGIGDYSDRIMERYCALCYTPFDEEGLCAFRGFHEGETEEGK